MKIDEKYLDELTKEWMKEADYRYLKNEHPIRKEEYLEFLAEKLAFATYQILCEIDIEKEEEDENWVQQRLKELEEKYPGYNIEESFEFLLNRYKNKIETLKFFEKTLELLFRKRDDI